MDTRTKTIIERISKDLKNEGFPEIPVYEKLPDGFGDYDSFHQLLIDERLNGHRELPGSMEVWNNMKRQINHLRKIILDAERDYKTLTVKYKTAQENYEELLKGS